MPNSLEEGQLMETDKLVSSFSFHITKAVHDRKTGKMMWAATASDTDPDLADERMTVELYQDFKRRAVNHEAIPVIFQSEYWDGGMPYISVSHYPDFDGQFSAGETTELYIDGKCLKARGFFYDNPLGLACFNSVLKSLYGETEVEPVRISIGFLDWKHSHGQMVYERKSLLDRCPACASGLKDKSYLAGHLIHLALTRVPMNRRTDIVPDTMEVTKSMKTKLEDAASIVGPELAEQMEAKEKAEMVGKSEAIVVKADEPVVEEAKKPIEDAKKKDVEDEKDDMEAEEEKECKDKKHAMKSDVDELKSAITEIKGMLTEKSTVSVIVENHPLDSGISTLKAVFTDTVSKSDMTREQKLHVIQEAYAQLGQLIVNAVNPVAQAPVEKTVSSGIDVETLKAALSDVLQPLVDKLSLVTQQSASNAGMDITRTNTVQRRSLQVPAFNGSQPEVVNKSETPKLQQIIRKSVYGSGS